MLLEIFLDLIARHRKKLFILCIVGCLLLVGYVIYINISRAGRIAIETHIVPGDAHIIIDGEKIGFHTGTIYLTPGTHTVAVEKEGFSRYKEKMTFDNDRTLIVTGLSPQSDDAKEWAADHQASYSNNEQYAAKQAAQDGKYFFKKNPLAQKLPVKDPYYSIGYVTKEDDSMEVIINTPSPRYRFFAVKMIRTLGYEPSDYTIVFKDYTNPLENSQKASPTEEK